MKLSSASIVTVLCFCAMYCKLNQSFMIRRTFGASLMSMSSKAGKALAPCPLNTAPLVEVVSVATTSFSGDLLVVPFYKPVIGTVSPKESAGAIAVALKQAIPDLSHDLKKLVGDIIDEHTFKGDESSKALVRAYGLNSNVKYVALVGLGASPKEGTVGEAAAVRQAAALGKTIAALAKETSAESVAASLLPGANSATVHPILLGMQDALYVDERFKKVPEGGFPVPKWKSLTFLGASKEVTEHTAQTQKLSRTIASGVHFAKDLVGESLP